MFHSAVRTLKAHRIRPDARQCRLIDVQLEINSLPGLMAPTNEITHRVTRNSQKKRAPSSQPFCCFVGLTE
jgi:hypothetical protein